MKPTSDRVPPEEVMTRLELSRDQLKRALRRAEIPSVRFGRRYVILRPRFEEFLRTGK